MINASDIKRGGRIELEGDPYTVLDVRSQTPSARGAATLVKAKIRNLRTNNVFDKTFKASDKIDEPQLELRPVQYLYKDDDAYHFMDTQSYEQFGLRPDELGDDAGYLLEGLGGIRSVVFNGKVISVELPQTVVLKIEQTDPAIKGATAQAQTKPATLETGLVVNVPAHVNIGDVIRVGTENGEYLKKA